MERAPLETRRWVFHIIARAAPPSSNLAFLWRSRCLLPTQAAPSPPSGKHVPPLSANMPSSTLPFIPRRSVFFFFPRPPFRHHAVGVVTRHVPLFSANKIPPPPRGPAAPLAIAAIFLYLLAQSCFTPPPFRSSAQCSPHCYVRGDARLLCIWLFSPLWQAGRHANMQNGDRRHFVP